MRKSFIAFAMSLALLLVSVGVKAQGTTYLNEDFESTATSSVPSGWDNTDVTQGTSSSTSTNYLWKVYSGGYNSSSKCVRLYCYYYYVSSARLKTPAITLNAMKDATVSFVLKNGSATVGDFSLYVTTDDGVTKTPLVQHELTGTTWTEYNYSLAAYKGQTIKLIFEGAASTTSAYYYVDDIVVKDAPTCQAPADPYITGLTGSGATLNWSLDTRYGYAPDQFSVTLKDASGNTVYYNGNVAGTNTSFSFTGLSGNTTYTAWIRSNCQPSYHGTSDSVSVQFTTLAAAINPPYYQDFDSLNSMSDGNFYYSNASLNTTGSYAYGNSGKSIKLTTTVADGAYIIFPLLNIAANNVEVDYYIRRQSSSTTNVSLQAGYLTDPSDIEGTFVPVSIDSLPKDANWANKRFNTGSVTDTQSPVMLCIYIGSGLAMSAYVDNVAIHTIPTCIRPENLTITNYGASDVTLDWSMANANNVRVYAMDPSDSTILATALATTHPYTMTGLTPQTDYLFAVRGMCTSTDSSEISTGVTVQTRCATAATPLFVEGAESTTGSALPDCWETGHIHKAYTGTTAPFYTGTNTHHSGSRGFALRDMASGNIAYLCSQKMDFGQTAGAYSFRYWYYRPSGTTTTYNGEGLKIFVTPTVGDTTNAVEVVPFVNRLAGFSPTGSTGWNEYEGVINYTGQGYIMVVGYSKYGNSSYFDDMEVFATPNCPKPLCISVGNPTQNTAEISWTAGQSETQWLVSYTLNQGSTTVATVTDSLVSGQPQLTISNLNSATTYTVANASVRAYCGVGDTSEVVTLSNVNFTTQCAVLNAFPYTMGFEEDETYVVYNTYRHPMCWTHYNDYATTTSSYHYYPYAGTSNPRTGSRALYYYAGKTSTSSVDTAIWSLPQIDTTVQPVNNLRIKFWSRSSSTSYSHTVFVGVMTNPNDPSTFVKVDSVVITGNTYAESVFNLNNYAGNGTYVAFGFFKTNISTSYAYDYIDDVTLEAIPSCADLSGGLTVTAASDSTVTLAMSDLTATNWQYAYGLTGTSVTQMTPVNATGSTLTLTGLTEATTYDIYVRRDCGNNDYSPWIATTFSTTSVPATMPYVCGFEDTQENARWQYTDGAGVNVFTIGDATSAVYAGTKAIYITTDRMAASPAHTYNTSSSTLTYAYRTMHFDAKGYQVELKFKATGGESNYDFGRIILCSTTENLIGGTGTSLSSFTAPASVAEFDDDYRVSSTAKIQLNTATKTLGTVDADGWHTISYFLDMTNRPGDYNLVLIWNNDASAGTASYPLAVDNINIYELTCIPPTIRTDSVSSTGFKLNLWHLRATQFEVVVDDESFTAESVPDSAVYRQIVNNPYAWITGLTANTQYYYAVRSICGANDTSIWSDVSSINTLCAMVNLPVIEGFEEATSVNCWQNFSTTGSISRNTGYKHSGTASMMIAEAYAVSPELNVTTLAPDMLNGWCYSTTDSAQFAVGVMTDPNDASTYEPLTLVTIPTRNTWTEFTSYFTPLTDPDYSDFYNARYIVIYVPAGETVYFDDFIIDQTPTCPKPTEVSITNITAHSFDISFTNNAPGCTSWQVTTNGTPHIINTNPATITGLNAASDYEVQIAAICSATDTSYYTLVGNVRTLCDKINLPWSTGFESSEGYTHTGSYYAGALEEQCWNTLNVKYGGATYPYYYVSTTSSYVHTGTQGLYTYTHSSATKDKMYLILPEFVEASNALKIKFWYKNYGTSTSYSQLLVGYMTDINVDSTFVTIEALDRYNSWAEAEVLTNAAGLNVPTNARIALCIDRSGTYGYGLYLDDISVAQIRNCSDPNTPVVSNITPSSATVTFTDTCSTHNSWQYVYGIRGFNPNTTTPTAVDSTLSFTLSGLTDDTNYEVYVRAICGVGDTSNYVKASFNTLCTPFHVTANNPFSESFTDFNYGAYITNESPCYTLPNQYTSSTSYMAKAYPTTDPSTSTSSYKYCYAHSADNTDKCLYWYMYSSFYPNGGTILRQFRLDADSVYELSAWVRTNTSTSYSTKFSALLGTSTTTLDTLTTKTVNGSSVSSQYIGGQYWYFYNTLYEQIKTVVSVNVTGDYYIGFNMSNASASNAYAYAYLDDWTMRAYSGCAPKIATVDSVTTSSAHVSMSGSAYQFEYVLNDTTATTTIVNTTEFDITGLSTATAYTLYYRTYCNATNYSEWLNVPFTTACGNVDNFPYTQDFEAYSTGYAPICWDNSASTATSSFGEVWGVYSNSSNKMLRMWNYNTQSGNAVIETPTFSLPAQPVELAFDYTNNVETNDFLVKISTNGGASYTTIGTYPTSDDGSRHEYGADPGTFTHVIIDLTNYAGQNVKFQLYNQATYGYGAVFFDNMTISAVPPCREPQSAPTITGTTMTTLSAQAAMAGKDTIEFGIAPYTAGVTTASITSTVLSTDGNCTFTGLTGSTGYAVWYRYHCDSNQVSDWSTAYARGTTTASDCFDPQNVHTIGIINDHHAEITWGAAPNALNYTYELYQGTSAAGTLVDSAVTTQKPDTIVYDSLSANTDYFFRVRGFCSGDTTAWVGISIQTTYPTMTMPFICNFENATINNAWQFNNIGSSTNELIIGTSVSNGGSQALYVSDDASTHNYTVTSTSNADAEILLEMPAGNYLVQYDWEGTGESCCDYGRVFLVPSSTTISTISTSLPSGGIALDYGSKLNMQISWTSVQKIVSVPTDGVYKLVVGWHNDGSVGTQPPFAIDNISIRLKGCDPKTATVSDITTTSAHVTMSEPAYRFGYVLNDTTQTETLVDTTEFDLTGLNSATAYTLYCRTYCDSVKYSEWSSVQFVTVDRCADHFHSIESDTICYGENYTWRGRIFAETGVYYDSLIASDGCDSVYELNLTANPHYYFEENVTVQGSQLPYSWHGQKLRNSGVYYDLQTTVTGCDSIYKLNLTVIGYPAVENLTVSDVTCSSFRLSWTRNQYGTEKKWKVVVTDPASNRIVFTTIVSTASCMVTGLSNSTEYTATVRPRIYSTSFGDPTTTTVTTQAIQVVREIQTICQGETYYWHGLNLTTAGIYYDTVLTATGCELRYELTLTVNPSYNFPETQTICQGGSYTWRGRNLTAAGVYYDSLKTVNGCDSVYELTLTVNPTYLIEETEAICQGESYTWHGRNLTAAGVYYDSLTTLAGCDSVIKLTLTVNPTYFVAEDTTTTISQLPFSWHGNDYRTSGVYYDSLQTVAGCDSVFALNLTVTNDPAVQNLTVSDTTYNSFRITWSAGGVETQWRVEVKDANDSVILDKPTTRLYCDVTGLTASSTYTVTVRPRFNKTLFGDPATTTANTADYPYPAVENLTVSDITYNSFSITWTPVGNEGTWVVEVKDANDSTVLDKVTSRMYCDVTGLTDSTSYTVTVTPRYNKTSFGDPATTTATTTAYPYPAVENLTVSDITYNSFSITWTPVGNEGTWVVEVKDANDSTVLDKVTSRMYCDVTGLTDSTSYTVTVTPRYNKTSFGDPATTTATTTAYPYPAVQNLTVSDITHNSFHIDWTPVGGEGTWKVEVKDANNTVVLDKVTSRTYCDVTGLTESTSYIVTVTPRYNKTSFGDPATTTATTIASPYPAVENLNVSNITSNSFRVTWTPDSSGTESQWYVEVKNPAGTVVCSKATTRQYYDATGLTASTEYTVIVRPRFNKTKFGDPATVTATTAAEQNAPAYNDDNNGNTVDENNDSYETIAEENLSNETFTPAVAYVNFDRLFVENIVAGSYVTIVDAAGKTICNEKVNDTRFEYGLYVRGIYHVVIRNEKHNQTLKVVY